MWIRLKMWIAQITWGSAIAFASTLCTMILQGPIINQLIDMGLSPDVAKRIQAYALALGTIITWLARSPKQKPLFTNDHQVAVTPNDQKESVIIKKEDDKQAAKKD